MWPSICEAVLPNSLIQWISTWRCGVPAETPAPHPLQTSWSSDWAVPAVCLKLHQRDTTPPKTPTPPLPLFSLSHVVFTSASSHLNCTGSSLKGAVGARPSSDHFDVNYCRNANTVCMRRPCLSATPSYRKDETDSGLTRKESMQMGLWFYNVCRLNAFSPLKVTHIVSPQHGPHSAVPPFGLCVNMYSKIHTEYEFSFVLKDKKTEREAFLCFLLICR